MTTATLDRNTVEDVIVGCGQPAGEAGYNLARVAALLADMPEVPGTTVNRYCASSVQAMRMAAHAIKAGEGDVFVTGGVETVSRFLHGASDTGPHNEKFSGAEAATAERTLGGAPDWTPPAGMPQGLLLAASVPEALELGRQVDDEVFVVGGAQIYREALPLADAMVLTWVDLEPPGDTHFPDVDWSQWQEVGWEQYDGWATASYHRKPDSSHHGG